jgi:membrane protein implicated in regulation of membrane protease activity
MVPSWGWAILAAVLALAELHAPGSYLVWIALGAVLTAALSAAYALSTEAQLLTMALASAASCVLGWFIYRRLDRHRSTAPPLNEREVQQVGETGVVASAIVNGAGKVRLGDTLWLAEGPDLPAGAPVVVTAVRRARLRVRPADPTLVSPPPPPRATGVEQ